ncbi:IucA/IucC family protein [Paenibacillus harenae]|uniref:IucA/IucC family protein n=1 Tax=Paenibacillus harenae TaxID=306543 RepID=UPI0004175375|nr:IucA/IucC family protein [Paenibacillus harenae]
MTQRAREIAEKATLESFLNCYLRETGKGCIVRSTGKVTESPGSKGDQPLFGNEAYVRVPLLHMTLYVRASYLSPTGRHRFAGPVYWQVGGNAPEPIDYITAITLLVRELSRGNDHARSAELIQRVVQSCNHIETFIQSREDDAESLYGEHSDFIQAEQALLFGHLTHPTPKSRQGFADWKQNEYAPELKGQFQLHYFWSHRSLVVEASALGDSAVELIKSELRKDPEVDQDFKDCYCGNKSIALIPVHPNQAEWLLCQDRARRWLEQGLLGYLGAQGRSYMATSSLRTVYHPEAQFMLKLSIQVKITNSMRINKFKELVSGVESSRLLSTCIPEFHRRFPGFSFIGDPAYLTLMAEGDAEESGFEVIVRDNPFREEEAKEVTLIAALVQDPLPGSRSRLAHLIDSLSQKEGRSSSQVSLDWFRRYLDLSLKPMVWLFLKYGIALEAHQQNCLIRLLNGYPSRFYYRDNQGYYYCRSTKPMLDGLLPELGEKSGNIYDDRIVDERFRYYLIVNHMLGLINGFGMENLIDERVLLAELRSALEKFLPMNREPSIFLESLLKESSIPCKANLLTRLYDMDELDCPLEQAVYVPIDNPLVKELPSMRMIHKAKQVTFRWRKEAVWNGSGQA